MTHPIAAPRPKFLEMQQMWLHYVRYIAAANLSGM